jgi:hypothetical protein
MTHVELSEGRQVRTRFIWHVDDRDACRWEQALSIDGGLTWETNWYMDFRRSGSSSIDEVDK